MRNLPIILLACLMMIAGCTRHRQSSKEPIHFNPNMDQQERYETQGSSAFFENGAAMRLPVEGTIARGLLKDDIILHTARNHRGELVKTNPLPVTMDLLKRGQNRFNIFCSPCHGKVGDGRGIMLTRGYLPIPGFDDPRLLDLPDGYFFDVMTNGLRNMPAYRSQVPVMDRWAIVAYVRALQRAKTATFDDLPSEIRDTVK